MKTSTAIIIAGIVVAISLLVVNANKQDAIKAQAELKAKQDNCELALKGLMNQWGNIISAEYSELYGECEVSYLDVETRQVLKSPLSWMATK